MLSRPKNGWTIVSIGEFEASASYLIDIPFDWLKSCLYGLQNRIPITFFVEEEGSHTIITSYYEATYITIDDGDGNVESKKYDDIEFMELTRTVINDILAHFEDWVHYTPYVSTQADFEDRRIQLKQLLDSVEYALTTELKRCGRSNIDVQI